MGDESKKRELAAGYSYEVDRLKEQDWHALLSQFEDANIYQTWPYAAVISGERNMSHVVVRKNGEVVAIAQARMAKLPSVPVGIAYMRWAPLWRRRGQPADSENFRQALRAIRREYVLTRHLVLRIFPQVIDHGDSRFSEILSEEGFSLNAGEPRARTIFMALTPTLDELRTGMNAHWKRELKVGEKNKLNVVEGSSDEIFADFVAMYKEMVSRKKFVEPNDIHQFREIQRRLPEGMKMHVMLAKSGGEVQAGLICSAIGDTAVYLFGATSNGGMKSRGSYLLHWKLLGELKERGTATYNLNGINPVKNPGTYKFKNDLAGLHGTDVFYAGRFDADDGGVSRLAVDAGDGLRVALTNAKRWLKASEPSTKTAPVSASAPVSPNQSQT